MAGRLEKILDELRAHCEKLHKRCEELERRCDGHDDAIGALIGVEPADPNPAPPAGSGAA